MKAYPSERIEDYWLREEFKPRRLSENVIIGRLTAFGLGPYEVELIMLRYVEEKKMAEIVREQGWLNVSSATHYLKQALSKLRRGGFKL